MNYENMSFEDLVELASNNPQEFKKIGGFIYDSGITIFKED